MVPNMPGQGENEDILRDDSVTGAETGTTQAERSSDAEAAAPASSSNVEPAPPATGEQTDAERVQVSSAQADDAVSASGGFMGDDAVSAGTDSTAEDEAAAASEALAAAADAANAAPDESAAATGAAASGDAAPPASAPIPEGVRKFKRGDVLEGTVKETSPTQVTVALDETFVGVIPAYELERMNKRNLDDLRPGEKVMVYVVNLRDVNGNILLSYNRAVEEMDWQRAETFRQSQDVYESRVAGYNKGGLIVRFGRLRGFVPQSQMSADRRQVLESEGAEERWSSMVNEPILIKVVEVDRQRNRLILSERSASRESREKRKENLIGQLTVGEVRMGRVVSLEDFGAFVDIGGAEGLVHLTELSWHHVTHPRELLQVGQEVKVEVISVDPVAKRIGLSMKRQAPDPWDTIALGYQIGQLVRGEVTKLTKFGAFAQLVDVPEIEGLIHISELSDKRVQHPREVVKEGDVMTLRVVKIDVTNRRLGLSLKRVNSAEYMDSDWQDFPDT